MNFIIDLAERNANLISRIHFTLIRTFKKNKFYTIPYFKEIEDDSEINLDDLDDLDSLIDSLCDDECIIRLKGAPELCAYIRHSNNDFIGLVKYMRQNGHSVQDLLRMSFETDKGYFHIRLKDGFFYFVEGEFTET